MAKISNRNHHLSGDENGGNNMATDSARARVNSLLDENSFVEIGALVNARNTDFNLANVQTPADGVVTGYGQIDGRLVYVYSQDSSVLGGAVGEMHAKKIVRIYEMAVKVGAPVIGLIDSSGIRLEEATDALNAFGEIYRAKAKASGVVPQISAVFGNCGGGLAIINGLSDFTFMADKAKIFVNSPNAVDNNKEEVLDTASAKFQAESGNVDFVGSEEEVIGALRQFVSLLPSNNEAYDAEVDNDDDDLNRNLEGFEVLNKNALFAISKLADFEDMSNVFEIKKDFGKDIVAALVRISGRTVGVVACNEKKLSADGADKAARLIRFCDAFELPVITLADTNGFATTKDDEIRLPKALSELTYEYANATVPKITVICGEAVSSAYNVFNSKGLGADVVYAWQDSKIGIMNSKDAAYILKKDDSQSLEELENEYETLQGSVMSAAKRGYVDTIISLCDTRKYLIGALDMLYTKSEDVLYKKHGSVK